MLQLPGPLPLVSAFLKTTGPEKVWIKPRRSNTSVALEFVPGKVVAWGCGQGPFFVIGFRSSAWAKLGSKIVRLRGGRMWTESTCAPFCTLIGPNRAPVVAWFLRFGDILAFRRVGRQHKVF